MSEAVRTFLRTNQERFLDELITFLQFPSISTDPSRKEDVQLCASWLRDHLQMLGLQNVQLFPTEGHPVVYGEWLEAGAQAPTVLVYGHYDVQPVDPVDLWDSPPFRPTIRDGAIYARGAMDDKGQVWLQLKALEAWLRVEGRLPVNVKVLIEGEEEIGSVHLGDFVKQHRQMLDADVVLISDTAMLGPEKPAVCYGLRGLAYVELHVRGPRRDLHSGSFGGAVDNPANVLSWMIAQLKDRYGRITIPGFYDDVRPLSELEQQALAQVPFDPAAFAHSIGVPMLYGEAGYSPVEWLWTRPTLDVNGLWSGFQGKGAKTIIPAAAGAKISMRLVPDQSPADIAQKTIRYLQYLAPPTVEIDVLDLYGGDPVLVDPESPPIQVALKALETVYQTSAYLIREGGSIPIVSLFQKQLEATPVLMGFALPTENAHSPNEHFHLDNFYRGMETVAVFYELLAATMAQQSTQKHR